MCAVVPFWQAFCLHWAKMYRFKQSCALYVLLLSFVYGQPFARPGWSCVAQSSHVHVMFVSCISLASLRPVSLQLGGNFVLRIPTSSVAGLQRL